MIHNIVAHQNDITIGSRFEAFFLKFDERSLGNVHPTWLVHGFRALLCLCGCGS